MRVRPGLLAIGGDSSSKGCGFESQHCILDGNFFTFICCANCNVCLKRQKYTKRGWRWSIFYKRLQFKNDLHFCPLPETIKCEKLSIQFPYSGFKLKDFCQKIISFLPWPLDKGSNAQVHYSRRQEFLKMFACDVITHALINRFEDASFSNIRCREWVSKKTVC